MKNSIKPRNLFQGRKYELIIDYDYLFMKLVIYAILPNGFKRRSLTGRVSNNLVGRPGNRKSLNQRKVVNTTKVLVSEKFEYILGNNLENLFMII